MWLDRVFLLINLCDPLCLQMRNVSDDERASVGHVRSRGNHQTDADWRGIQDDCCVSPGWRCCCWCPASSACGSWRCRSSWSLWELWPSCTCTTKSEWKREGTGTGRNPVRKAAGNPRREMQPRPVGAPRFEKPSRRLDEMFNKVVVQVSRRWKISDGIPAETHPRQITSQNRVETK